MKYAVSRSAVRMLSKPLLLRQGCVRPRLPLRACPVVTPCISATSSIWRHQAAITSTPSALLAPIYVRHASTESKDPTHRVWTVPNVLTGIRLLASPFLSYLIMTSQLQAAVGVFFAAGLLDYLDGAIARAWDQRTKLGGFLDPVADKALVACAAIPIIMTHPEVLHPAVVAVVVGRDVGLLIGGLYIRATTKPKGTSFPPFFPFVRVYHYIRVDTITGVQMKHSFPSPV
jgi:phosphatidylglycerophosphate synthase